MRYASWQRSHSSEYKIGRQMGDKSGSLCSCLTKFRDTMLLCVLWKFTKLTRWHGRWYVFKKIFTLKYITSIEWRSIVTCVHPRRSTYPFAKRSFHCTFFFFTNSWELITWISWCTIIAASSAVEKCYDQPIRSNRDIKIIYNSRRVQRIG